MQFASKQENIQSRQIAEVGTLRYKPCSLLRWESACCLRDAARRRSSREHVCIVTQNDVRDTGRQSRLARTLLEEIHRERFRAGSSMDLGVPTSRAGCDAACSWWWFLVLGDEDGQKYLRDTLSEKYEYRCDDCIGPEDNQRMTLLNRIVTYHKDGSVSFEADPRHAEMIIRQLGLEGSKGISTPGEKKKLSDVVATSVLPPMNAERTTLFRSLVMRAQFLGQDRADIAESVKSLTTKNEESDGGWFQGPETTWKILDQQAKSD